MRLPEMKQEMFASLDKYEESIRRYCDKVDVDRPWVGEAIWNACWTFRKGLIMQLDALEHDLDSAKRTRDPG